MRTTLLNATMIVALERDIVDTALPMLKRQAHFIFEDAVIRANKRGHRDDIDWNRIKSRLEGALGQDLMSVSARTLLDRASGAYDKTIRIRNKATISFLESMNGNKTAGYCFPWWDKEFTQRRIRAQQHAGDGLHNSAKVLED